MRYCTRCLYPANHSLFLTFDEQGVCSGCRIHEEKDWLDWDERETRLRRILESYRHKSGANFDCVVPVSGGRDSYFIVHVIKKLYGLNPLLVSFNHHYNTKIGIRNLARLITVFDCDHITYTVEPGIIRKIVRRSLKEMGTIYWHYLAGALTFPVQVAVRFKIPLVVWGVNAWQDQVGMYSHLDEVEMTKKARNEHALMGRDYEDMISAEDGIVRRDMEPFVYPSDGELAAVGVRGIYLSNYIRWDAKRQHELMIERYGYETAPQQRTFNTYEDVDCFYSAGTQDYLKFLKLGFGKVTDHACREIRLKRLTREEGIDLVRQYEEREPADLEMFLRWSGISREEFFAAVDTKRDPRIWQKTADGEWRRTDCLESHIKDAGVDAVRLEKVEECHYLITDHPENAPEDRQLLMGRSYINKYNYCAVDDSPLPEAK